MNQSILIALLVTTLPVVAQQQTPSPTAYQKAVEVLQSGAPPEVPSPGPHKKRRAPDISGTIGIGNAIELHRQVPLPPNALLALNLSAGWLNSGPPPVSGSGGRVLFTYGQNLPTVVCAVLQVCELDLEAGEKLIKDSLDWGDHRFEVTPRTTGTGADEFTYLVLKPTESGLDTTMTVGTDKRPYYVRLISTENEHMARVAFLYPDDEAAKRKAEEAAKLADEERQKAERERLARLNTAKPVRNWHYTVRLHGKDAAYLKPAAIGDDGVHTYITLPEEARHRGLPVIEISDERGPIPANAHWQGNQLVIDAVFERACLLESVGEKQQRACIRNHGLKAGESSGNR
ncbi:MAG: TrbG/VirB9 family P-type conjugative transfer protein [Silvibacterium sp.]|nr:TrbG/VirB9 family P-type conjugative transfer protein [Silvibacterium sp.]